MDSISLVVNTNKLSAKMLMYLKKETGMSPTELSKKVANHVPLFNWDITNYRSLTTMNRIYRFLESAGLSSNVYLDSKLESIDFFENFAITSLETGLELGLTEEDMLDEPLQ